MEFKRVDPKSLKANPNNPRRTKSSAEDDARLIASIKAIGLIQPPIVRLIDDELVVVAGDRRRKCSIAAELTEIPVFILTGDDSADPLRSLAENVQRVQMGPVDQWRAIEALCGSGWSEEAIATAFSMTVRTIRKLRLLARILPAMLDRMVHDLPREDQLRTIAAATLDEQAAIWKRHKPKRGTPPSWFEIARTLEKTRISVLLARFDDETAQAFGVNWEDDLFGPADRDNRTTADIEAFLAAQHDWVEKHLPTNGVILEATRWGEPILPPNAEPVYGKPRKDDKLGFAISPSSGEVREAPFRIYERPKSSRGASGQGETGSEQPKAPRPDISKKGVERIGAFRTEALHQAFSETPIDDAKLLGLLVLALAARNVTVTTPAGTWGGKREAIGRRVTDGGHLTSDLDTLRAAAREMLAQVLFCRPGMSQSGIVARLAGEAIGADEFLPNMAEDDFLKTLSKNGIESAVRALGIAPRNTGKEMRAALIEHLGDSPYVLPAAHFALDPSELTTLQSSIASDVAWRDRGAGDVGVGEDGGDPLESADGDETDDEALAAA